jgi:glycerol-3-phosphate acyltransferase PlsY
MSIEVIGLLLGAYVLGAIPFVYLLGRLSGVDLRDEGSRNVGGTNLFRTVGPLTGVVGAGLDIGKGLAPVLAARALEFNDGVAGLAAIAAVVGQCWPIFLRFRGGRGISVVAGAVVAFSPLTFALAVLPAFAGLGAYVVMRQRQHRDVAAVFGKESKDSRTVPLFMLVSVVLLPLAATAVGESSTIALTFAALSLIIILRRLTAGLRQDRGSPIPLLTRLRNRFLYDRAQV